VDQLPPIITTTWLTERLADVTVADVRWYLDGRNGLQAFRAGHLPGAVFIDLDQVLAAPAAPEAGRHPLPDPEVFGLGLAEAGIAIHDPVVAYDDQGGMAAGRLVWMLRILGLPAALLDGGLEAWDGELVTGFEQTPTVERPVMPWPESALATADQVAALLRDGGVVVDCRAEARYRGEIEPVDPRAGHIPGALNVPFSGNLDDRQRFRSPAELGDRFSAAGVDGSAVLYCGSGVSACHNALAMEAAGLERPRIFVGSWSQWSSDLGRPAATGAEPGDPAA
jgi:thiosulfate/3-mercaptopyruvate sulfurtransferase